MTATGFRPQASAAQVATSQQGAERRGWFGISLSCEECFVLRGPDRVAYVRFPAVLSVESGSPAAQGGLRRGDTLIAAEGLPLTTPEGFLRYAEARPNQPIRITVRNAGQQRELTITPSERASAATIRDFYVTRVRIAQRRGLEALRAGLRMPMGSLGMLLDCEGCAENTIAFRSPPMVTLVDVDGPAHRAGVRRGDTLIGIESSSIGSPDAGRVLRQLEPGQRVTLRLRRNGQERRIVVTAAIRDDATREDVALWEEYRAARDSVEAARATAMAAMRDIVDVQVAPRMLRMQPDAQVQLTATVYGADGMPRAVPVRWQSNNINVVEVLPDGTARGIAPGTAIVQAIVEISGRRRAGQATVMVHRDGAPMPGRPGMPGGPLQPPQPPDILVPNVVIRGMSDSMAKTLVNCAEPVVNAINPARACWDQRPIPRNAPLVAVPGTCPREVPVSPTTINVHVSETGEVLDALPFAPSSCQEFTEVAQRAARELTFSPATRNGAPVNAWVLMRMRPAPR